MEQFDPSLLTQLYVAASSSHKGENGKVMIIGGSSLFHAASLWALTIASKIVDMVFYASTPENNAIVQKAKEEFRNGIVVPAEDIEKYIEESECILIGPGMMRTNRFTTEYMIKDLSEIPEIDHEGIVTYHLTKYLLHKYPQKKWVIDAGALQMMETDWLKALPDVVVTPHQGEFETVFGMSAAPEHVTHMAKEYGCIILLKGERDIISNGEKTMEITGGNAGMTKGGTGDVLAGLIAALGCKNDLWMATVCGSYLNKKAGESLFQSVGLYFNASDLAQEIPKVMKAEILS